MKFIKGLLGFVLVLTLLVIGVGGYLGIIPGVSKLFGFDKPKDLGITYSQADIQSAFAKGGATERTIMASATADGKTLVYEGAAQVSTSFTSSELTAATNGYDRWVNNPFSNIQIKITGNTAQVSGKVDMETLFNMVNGLGYSRAQIDEVMTKYRIPYADLPFYVSGTGSITDNRGTLTINALELGRIPVPQSLISQHQGDVATFAMNSMRTVPNLDIKKAAFEDSKLVLDGTLPQKQMTVTKHGKVLAE